jgi:hypothetical protein
MPALPRSLTPSHALALLLLLVSDRGVCQITTPGFLNLEQTELPGTLLSHPLANDSEATGRTTSLNYLNGWLIVGAEAPGSRPGSDLEMRVYDISDPANPVRRFPSDFGLVYPGNRWHQGNAGWNAHGSAQSGTSMLPEVMRVQSFGGLVERGNSMLGNGVPHIGNFPIGYNRSSQAGPWVASFPWYGTPDAEFVIERASLNGSGFVEFQQLAAFDHVGAYGGGDWHPMFFGDLLIYARSGTSAHDGIVVYRLQYNDFDDPANRSITPHYVGSLTGGFRGYWPNLFSDGTGLYVIGSETDILIGADISQAADPAGDGTIEVVASLTVPGFTNASYPVYQDQFGFIHNRKVDMTSFLAGDANPVVLTLQEGAPNFADTTQMSLPLGNLWITGGYPHGYGTANYQAQGMSVWVHQQAPDTTPPRVSYHIPQANRTNYPRHAPLSFLLHEHPSRGGPRNGVDFTVRPVLPDDSLGSPVAGFLIHDFSGCLTFTPEGGLAADTTYQVSFLSDPTTQSGFRDAAGNYIEPYSFRFSTGGGIDSTAPPVLTSLTADVYQPAPSQTVMIQAAATGDGPLEFRFNFNGAWSAWSEDAFASHVYPTAGRPRVLVQIRDVHGSIVTHSLRLLVNDPLPPGPRPTQSNTLAVGDDAGERRLWVVNPDANTVSVLAAGSGAKLDEHAVGDSPRGIARDANGRYWVACHGSDELRVLNPDGSSFATVDLDYGAAPFGVAAAPDGQTIFVSLYGSSRLQRYSASDPNAAPLEQATFPTPRAIAVSADGTRVFVTRFLSPDLHAEVGEFNGLTLQHVRTIRLSSANPTDGGDRASGVPNYLAAIAIAPDGSRAAIASKQDNVQRGLAFGVGDLTHETAVRAVVSFIDLATNEEIRDTRRDFDNSDSPSALAFTPLGDTLLVALQGNNRVVGTDMLGLAPVTGHNTAGSTETSPAVITLDLGTGLAPQGVLVDPVAGRLFTQDFMSRTVTVRDATLLLAENRTVLTTVATTGTVANELLPSQVLTGKQIFYNAADPRMSADSYLSCATCHLDGGHDGRVWDFTGRGEGLRRTIDLRGRSGVGHGNVHWTGNFDEIQDFEHDIRGPFGGTGFLTLSPEEFAEQHPSPATGKGGLSPELDALAAYVSSLTPSHLPRSPARNADGTLTAAALAGRTLFQAQNCASCHGGAALSNSALGPVDSQPLFDTGTQSLLSGTRLGQALTGLDTPTLHGLHASRVFLHHGQAATLAEAFGYAGGALLLAADGERLSSGAPGVVGLAEDDPAQGGGGFLRGALGGSLVTVGEDSGASERPGVRFAGVDGGIGGGARIAIRYARQYGNGAAVLRVNGVEQGFALLQQEPDNGWQISGWRWHVADADLLPGPVNVVEVLRPAEGFNDFHLNAILVSGPDDLASAEPHRLVTSLPPADQANLVAYLEQLDGRDDSGSPLAAPPPPESQAPGIVSAPGDVTLAIGNSLRFTVAVSGTGPFTYAWRRGVTPVGAGSPTLEIPSIQPADAGSYTVTVTNAQGEAVSSPAQVTVNNALEVATGNLPPATVGQPYSAVLEATGGVSARTWSLLSGLLPPGLSLSAAGETSGTPASAARAEFSVLVSDSSGTASRTLALDAAPAGGFVSDPDLILHYPFDEGAGSQVWDVSPAGNNHATTVPGAQWVADGRFGGAYGPASLEATIAPFYPANQGDLDFAPQGGAFTISVWVRTTSTAGYQTIFGKDGSAPSWDVQYRLWTTNTTTQVQAVTGNQYGATLAATAPPLNDGQWHLLTLVNRLDGGTWRTRVHFDDGSQFVEFDTGAGERVANLLRIGDTSPGGNGWNGQIDDFRIYRRALTENEIADLFAPPNAPAATLALAPGQEPASERPYAEFDLQFSRPVQGLQVEEFVLGGTAGTSASHLQTLVAGSHYRLRVAGFAQPGSVTVQLPAGVATAVDDAEPNAASTIAQIQVALSSQDDLAGLSDEFDDAATLANWQRNYLAEGWTGADKLEVWDIDQSRAGHMRLVPHTSSWFQNYTGALAFKEVAGDFVLTLRLQAARRGGLAGRPTSAYSLGGIMLRTPRAFANAAPVPDPGFGTVLPWPPPAQGQPGHYTTPWQPGTENYIFLSYGFADTTWGNQPDTWYNEVKTTTNSVSELYAVQSGIPANTDDVTLQAVRVGPVFLLLRRHGADGPWLIENRFTRHDMPATLQTGITTYTDWPTVSGMNEFHHNRTVQTGGSPDLVVDADFFRLRRPAPAITQALLEAVPVSGQSGPLQELAATALADHLGDNAHPPLTDPGQGYDDWLRENLSPGQLVLPTATDPAGDAHGIGLPNLLQFALGATEPQPLTLELLGPPESRTTRISFPRNARGRGLSLVVEASPNLAHGSWITLATSIDGAPPSPAPGSPATLLETGGDQRTTTLDFPTADNLRFYRLRADPLP